MDWNSSDAIACGAVGAGQSLRQMGFLISKGPKPQLIVTLQGCVRVVNWR